MTSFTVSEKARKTYTPMDFVLQRHPDSKSIEKAFNAHTRLRKQITKTSPRGSGVFKGALSTSGALSGMYCDGQLVSSTVA